MSTKGMPGPRDCRRRPSGTPGGGLGEPTMSLDLACDGTAKLVTVTGELDMSNAHLLTELVEFVCRPPSVIEVDLSAVRHFSTHGVDALLRAQEIATTTGVALRLRDPAPCVRHLLGGEPSTRESSASVRHSPTSPPSDCSNSAPSTDATCSPNSCRLP